MVPADLFFVPSTQEHHLSVSSHIRTHMHFLFSSLSFCLSVWLTHTHFLSLCFPLAALDRCSYGAHLSWQYTTSPTKTSPSGSSQRITGLWGRGKLKICTHKCKTQMLILNQYAWFYYVSAYVNACVHHGMCVWLLCLSAYCSSASVVHMCGCTCAHTVKSSLECLHGSLIIQDGRRQWQNLDLFDIANGSPRIMHIVFTSFLWHSLKPSVNYWDTNDAS